MIACNVALAVFERGLRAGLALLPVRLLRSGDCLEVRKVSSECENLEALAVVADDGADFRLKLLNRDDEEAVSAYHSFLTSCVCALTETHMTCNACSVAALVCRWYSASCCCADAQQH